MGRSFIYYFFYFSKYSYNLFFSKQIRKEIFIYSFVSKEKIDKIENNKLLKDTKKIEFIIYLLFFIPVTPKDLLVYIGALLPIKPIRFMVISTFSRLPSIISATMVGNSITVGNWVVPVVVYSITAIIAILALYISKKKAGKDTDELMNILK